MSEPRISVILPTFRRYAPLLDTVADLLRQDYSNFEIIVADQNDQWPSDLGERAAACKRDRHVRWMSLDQPGVVVARNVAVAQSNGEILLFVDDDVHIPDGQFLRHHARLYQDTTVAAVAGRITTSESANTTPKEVNGVTAGAEADLSPLQQAVWFDRNGTQPRDVCTFCTCNGSVRRSAFLAIGGFDELFGGHSYGDDTDFALRLHRAGFRTRYDPTPSLIHRHVPMGGLRLSDRTSRVNWRASAEGFWLFVFRHGHRGMYRYLIFEHVLRKTILLRQNVVKPWRQFGVCAQTLRALPAAYARRNDGPQSMFSREPVAMFRRA